MRRGRAIVAMTLERLLGHTDASVWFRRRIDRGRTWRPDADQPRRAMALCDRGVATVQPRRCTDPRFSHVRMPMNGTTHTARPAGASAQTHLRTARRARRCTALLAALAVAVSALLVPTPAGAQAPASVACQTFYKCTIIAQTNGPEGLTGFGTQPSINDAGLVAFVGQRTVNGSTTDGLYVGDGSGPARNINPANSFIVNKTYGSSLQINNQNCVVAVDRAAGSPPTTSVRIWDANPGATTQPLQLVVTGSGRTGFFGGYVDP